jgi:hypothetical protein
MRYPKSDRSPIFDRNFAPHLNFPLEAFASGKHRIISLMANTGFGKSTLIETATAYIVAVSPGDMGIITQSDNDSATFSDTRLLPTLRAVEPVVALLPNDRYSVKKAQIDFPHMSIFIGGANLTTLQSKSLRYVLLDEAWVYRGGMIKEALHRTHDRSNSVVLVTGQAGLVGDEFDVLHETCAKHEYSWQCSACEQWHAYGFENIKWNPDAKNPETNEWVYARIVETCFMQCPNCGAEYPDNEFTRRELASKAQYLPTPGGNPIPGRLGLHCPAEGVCWIPWSTIALEFILANDAKKAGNDVPMRQWQQKREARPWQMESHEYDIPEIKSGGYKRSDFEGDTKIDGEVLRTLTVDVQRDHNWLLVNAWRADGTCRVLHYDASADWDAIKETAKRYYIPSALQVGLDSNYDPSKVNAYCAKNGTLSLVGNKAKFFAHVDNKGKPQKKLFSKINSILINNIRANQILWSSENVKDILNSIRSQIEIPDDFDNTFSDQMSAERKQSVISKTTGETSWRWEKISHRANHSWDAMAMSVVIALMSKRVVFSFKPEVISESNSQE